MIGPADYLRPGDWNVRCDRCGKKLKGSEARATWDNLYVCDRCWEPRHPQDFVRAVPEHPTPAFVRNPPDVHIGTADGIIMEDALPDYLLFEPGADLDYIMAETPSQLWFLMED